MPMLIALNSSSKALKKELLKHLKPDTIKVICECVINNTINKNIKVSDQVKRKIKRNCNKIWELVNLRTSQKKKKEKLVQEGGAFLGLSYSQPSLEVWWVSTNDWRDEILRGSTEVYEMLLIKAETLVNTIPSTVKQTQESLNCLESCWNFCRRKLSIAYKRVKQVKKGEGWKKCYCTTFTKSLNI